MRIYRRAGGWLLAAALGVAPTAGCKSGFQLSNLNPFAKPDGGTALEADDGGYVQSTPPPVSSTPEELSWSGTPFKKFGEAVSSPFKKTASKDPPKPRIADDDPVSLTSHTAPPGASLYIELAKMQERGGNVETAIKEYEKALKAEPKNLEAQLGIARLYDRQGKFDAAVAAYSAAVTDHPESAAAHNDLGLCQARGGKLAESVAELKKAVALEAEKPLYRNNLATVLVELGRTEEAYQTLVVAHGEAAARYNLGFLLNKRNRKSEALAQFQLAAAADPNFQPARQWIDALRQDAGTGASGLAAERESSAVRNASALDDVPQQSGARTNQTPRPLNPSGREPAPLPPITNGANLDDSDAANVSTTSRNRSAAGYGVVGERYDLSPPPAPLPPLPAMASELRDSTPSPFEARTVSASEQTPPEAAPQPQVNAARYSRSRY